MEITAEITVICRHQEIKYPMNVANQSIHLTLAQIERVARELKNTHKIELTIKHDDGVFEILRFDKKGKHRDSYEISSNEKSYPIARNTFDNPRTKTEGLLTNNIRQAYKSILFHS